MATKKVLIPRAKKRSATVAKNHTLLAEEASSVLDVGHYGRKLTPEILDSVLVRVAAGDTVKHVRDTIGVGAGLVYQRADDIEFGRGLAMMQNIGRHMRVDMMTEIAMNSDMSVAERQLITDIIWKVAKARTRDAYGERPLLNADKVTMVLDGTDMGRL